MALPQSRDSLIDKRLTELEARVATIEWRLPQVQLVEEPRQATTQPATRAELWQGKPVVVATTRGAGGEQL
jgi:hypothetical protein